MNFVYLKGIIKNIRYSHTINDTTFNRADLIVRREDGREDLLFIKFKSFSGMYELKENKEIELIGNLRSYSSQVMGKNKVEIYVFSYLDIIEDTYESCNKVKIDGRICKKDGIRTVPSGKHYIHFTVANNILTDDKQKINSYIPCVAWGKTAKEIESNYNVGDNVYIEGQLQSREYKKKTSDDLEIRMAHELTICEIKKI